VSRDTRIAVDPTSTDAVLFDLDGVITQTARLHAFAWKEIFDRVLEERAAREGEDLAPFDIEEDYPEHVDGKPRRRGIRHFLASRGIQLPETADEPGLASVEAIAEAKNERFHELLDEEGVTVHEDATALLDDLAEAEIPAGLFSASRNARRVLAAAGLGERFDIVVGGIVAADEGLAGKPSPETLLETARRMVAAPERCLVLEDSEAGVEAARRGGFGLVVGVDRVGHARALADSGADHVVASLDEIDVPVRDPADRPDALAADEILERVDRHRPVVFLDFDGTLSPIVEHPDRAAISDEMRAAVARLAERCPVAVVSGRGLDDVRERVGLDELIYAGSHGLEIREPGGERTRHGVAEDLVPALEAARERIEDELGDVDGLVLEPKPFSLAVHDRQVPDGEVERVRGTVEAVAGESPELRIAPGKRVRELRPDVDWDKGRAVEHLLDQLDVDPRHTPVVYVGDDVTDEDAFHALPEGIGVLVSGEGPATFADYGLAGPEAVRAFLDAVAGTLEGPS